MAAVDKSAILAILHTRLREDFERLTSSQKSAQAGATHPDARPEDPKDMRSTEASYLARGLAERVETLRDDLRALDLLRLRDFGDDEAAAPGALVTLETDDGDELDYFLAPAGGGQRIAHGEREILVLTPRSPLGAAIAGRQPGERIHVELPSGTLDAEIVSIA